MNYLSTVTSKGQVTIPQALRKKVGIEPGKQIQFELRDEATITIKPVRDFLSYMGYFKSNKKYSKAAARRVYIPAVIRGEV